MAEQRGNELVATTGGGDSGPEDIFSKLGPLLDMASEVRMNCLRCAPSRRPSQVFSVFHSAKVLAQCILPRGSFLRAFRRIAPIGASNRRRVVLFRNDDLITNQLSYPTLHP